MKIIDLSKDNYKKMISNKLKLSESLKIDVNLILNDVKIAGDIAVKKYTEMYDGIFMEDYKVYEEEIKEAYEDVDNDFLNILDDAIDNITCFHKKQIVEGFEYKSEFNSTFGMKVTPLKRVGLYIPGGKASYPSSVLMNAIPAKIAGVKEIVLITPPDDAGKANKNVLIAADKLGINEIYKVGGAQAIAALAYGTKTINKVDKIVGPGNKYVAEAKRQVFGLCDIDMIAGPSEIAVIADSTAKPNYIARDLLSQAEHDESAKCYLITDSDEIIEKTNYYVNKFVDMSTRKEILKQSIENNYYIFKAKNLKEMIEISNYIAPEHLEVLIKNPKKVLGDIINAGSIFLGNYSPEPVGDYFAGPNHTLPTNGTAKFASPLGVYDFIKFSSYIEYSKEELLENKDKIIKFATLEKLTEHANSIKERFDE